MIRRLLPGWFLAAWGREVTALLRAEESDARSRGRAALLKFRVMTLVDLLRAAWQTRQQSGVGLTGDVRLALRLFRRSPGFTAVAVLSLAIGVALGATAFSVLDPAFSRPLPFPQGDRLMSVRVATFQGETQRTRPPSYAQFRAWQASAAADSTAAETLAAYQRRWQQQEAPGGVEDPFNELLVQSVSPDFLPLLGARTSRGRGLTPEDYQAGAPPVVVLTDVYWRKKLAGRSDVLGSHVKVNGAAYAVVGVLSPDFLFGSQTPDVIRPMAPGTAGEPAPGEFVEVIARLRDDATPDRLTAELGAVLNRDRKPDSRTSSAALAEPLRARLYGWARNAYGPFAGAAALLLLLVTANVANLTLVRATGRRQEMVLRTALGAGRGRLARLVAIEAGLLTLAACAVGLLLSWWTIDLLISLNPRGVGGTHPVFDLRAAVFGGAVAAVTGTLAVVWPGLTAAAKPDRTGTLRHGPQQGTDSPRQRFSQRALVMCQIACALVVLTGAGLLAKTVLRMQSYDPGVDTRHLLTAEVTVPQMADDRGTVAAATRLLDELRAIPGVMSAGLTSVEEPSAITLQSEAGAGPATVAPADRVVNVSQGYFDALGVPVVLGRMLTTDEFRDNHHAALVNEEAVRRWWPGSARVIGSRIKLGDQPWVTVVGVVRNTSSLTVRSLASSPAARIYLPLAKLSGSAVLIARTTGEPLAILPALHARAQALDRRVRIQMPIDARANLEWEIEGHRDTAAFAAGLATFGLLLAAMGIYGVTTYAVVRRMREIGIRKALGAGTGHIVLTVSRETAALAIGGIAIGLAASAAVTRMLESMLFGTSPLDAWVFTAASLLTVGIVALATWVPMRTALRVDPVTTLRCE